MIEVVALAYLFVAVAAISYYWIYECVSSRVSALNNVPRRIYGVVWHVGSALWLITLVIYALWSMTRRVR